MSLCNSHTSTLLRTSLKASFVAARQPILRHAWLTQIHMNFLPLLIATSLLPTYMAAIYLARSVDMKARNRLSDGMNLQQYRLPETKPTSYYDFKYKNPWKEHTTNCAPEHSAILFSGRLQQISPVPSCPDFICTLSLSTKVTAGKIHPHTLGLGLSSVFYLFSCSFAYGLVLLQFCHLFSVQLDSLHDPLSLRSTGIAPSVTPHEAKQSSCPTGQTEGDAAGLTWSITGHLSQKGNAYYRPHCYSEHISRVLKESNTIRIPPAAQGAASITALMLELHSSMSERPSKRYPFEAQARVGPFLLFRLRIFSVFTRAPDYSNLWPWNSTPPPQALQ